ncbi:hypothetical protein D3C87_1560510 [compost metagenome]
MEETGIDFPFVGFVDEHEWSVNAGTDRLVFGLPGFDDSLRLFHVPVNRTPSQVFHLVQEFERCHLTALHSVRKVTINKIARQGYMIGFLDP